MGMNNGRWCLVAPCNCLCGALLVSRARKARLVVWGGETRAARHGKLAGQVMLELQEEAADAGAGAVAAVAVCRADAFYLGRPAPVLAIEDRLLGGATYLVLPVDRLPHGALTAASLAALSYDRAGGGAGGGGGGGGGSSSPSIAGGARSPFEYVKGDDGRTVIKVTPEFLIGAITATAAAKDGNGEACAGALCSTPELRKHYEQLVGAARGRGAWSPRLDTIKERNGGGGGRRGLALAAAAVLSPGRLSPVAVTSRLLQGVVETATR